MVGIMFRDRREAGRHLATSLGRLDIDDPVVLALPPDGIPVAAEIADALAAPMDVIMVRRLSDPSNRDAAFAAVTADGTCVYDYEHVPDLAGIEEPELNGAIGKLTRELAERENTYRGCLPALDLEGRSVILVTDGMSRGMRMIAAVRSIRAADPRRIIVAVPTASREAEQHLRGHCDDVICLDAADTFFAVGCSYQHYDPMTDEQVSASLERSRSRVGSGQGLKATG